MCEVKRECAVDERLAQPRSDWVVRMAKAEPKELRGRDLSSLETKLA